MQEVLRIVGELGDWTDPEPFECALWRAIEGDESTALVLRLSVGETAFLRELRDDSAGWILLTGDARVLTFIDLEAWAAICPKQTVTFPPTSRAHPGYSLMKSKKGLEICSAAPSPSFIQFVCETVLATDRRLTTIP